MAVRIKAEPPAPRRIAGHEVLLDDVKEGTRRWAPSAAELRTVLSTLTDGIQLFDASGELLTRNPAAARLYGLVEDSPTISAVLERWEVLDEQGNPLPDADRPLARVMSTGVGEEGTVVGIRHRQDGSVRWLSVSTSPILEGHGDISGYVSCARDLTERVETIRGLRVVTDAAQKLSSSLVPDEVISALTGAASELCSAPGERPRRAVLMLVEGDVMELRGLVDPTHSPTYPSPFVPLADNPYARQVLATGATMVTGFTPEDFGPSSSEVIRTAAVRNAAMVPMRRDGAIFAILAVSGRQESMISADMLTHLETLAAIGALAYANAEAHQRAEANSRTDPLTSLGNRRMLEERFAQLPRCPFAVLAIDVDRLKTVNDTHGHDAGDRLLRGVAAAMSAQIRPGDLLVRSGGDEFVALLVNCGERGAGEVRDRLLAAVSALSLPSGRASVSVGCAVGAPGEPPQEVLTRADESLYREKAGR